MKKNLKIWIFLGVLALAGLIYVIRIQNFVKSYTMPTTANEPGLQQGGLYFGSSLFTPERLDFVVFERVDEVFGSGKWVSRLIAQAGDTVHIRKGVVHINGENIDRILFLKHSYLLNRREYERIKENREVSDAYPIRDSIILAHLPDSFALENNFTGFYRDSSFIDETIEKLYGQPWNTDEFGPYIVPAEKFFVMGDNRHNAHDSRFIGVIDVSQLVAVIKN